MHTDYKTNELFENTTKTDKVYREKRKKTQIDQIINEKWRQAISQKYRDHERFY
jgi:hypothetical protein